MSSEAAIQALAADAQAQGASDVHLDLDVDAVRVRLRVDGRLRQWVPARLEPGGLRAAAWAVAGNGTDRLGDWQVASHSDGERLALRLRAERPGHLAEGLAALGMVPAQARTIFRMTERPGGLVVVAGPRGSGRRSTIAALLGGEARTRSVVTVDLALPGALTIAGLQGQAAIEQALSLDPDILALGDLADRGAAALAFQVAASGRRVLARVEAPDAIAAFEHLRALRVDRLALAAQLRAVTAQRLAQRLCHVCRRPVQASNRIAALLGFDPGAVIHESAGCGACDGRGTAGAIGVFELIAFDPAMARLVNDGADAALLARHAFLNAPRLDSAARSMARQGLIDAAEAVRLGRG
ncbi:ATPase, T2SS/T4P/T4SS family [Sphingomonas yantingensis]|uniref:General secretion pathway protein E n=1 Tax=Sphingomonas yantingensis TaxID=1241761 RepID=A0A7W9ANP9_9SPHN|nr:ATPase, T2SS/T4P/T4SS family [Sphingomonas yantingensis]MBB5697765.1 general secretion pathway protein E [Sphingomonas yantingensis]